MSNPGRPPTLDDEKKKTICLLVRAGCSRRRAAQYVGVAESTVRSAADRDPAFKKDLGEASVAMEVDCLSRIRNFADRSWRAAAWLLEKRLPGEYGNQKNEPRPPRPPRDIHESVKQTLGEPYWEDDDALEGE